MASKFRSSSRSPECLSQCQQSSQFKMKFVPRVVSRNEITATKFRVANKVYTWGLCTVL